jgi:hypothetical protein
MQIWRDNWNFFNDDILVNSDDKDNHLPIINNMLILGLLYAHFPGHARARSHTQILDQ